MFYRFYHGIRGIKVQVTIANLRSWSILAPMVLISVSPKNARAMSILPKRTTFSGGIVAMYCMCFFFGRGKEVALAFSRTVFNVLVVFSKGSQRINKWPEKDWVVEFWCRSARKKWRFSLRSVGIPPILKNVIAVILVSDDAAGILGYVGVYPVPDSFWQGMIWATKKKGPWLFRVFRGWQTTPLCGGHFINHYM